MNYPNSGAVASNGSFQRTPLYCRIVLCAFMVSLFGVGAIASATPQGQLPAPATTKPPAKKKYQLKVTKGDIIGISLKANKAKMSDIATDLAKRLGTQVMLGSSLTKETITLEFADLPLEPALRLLAPQVYVDYEIRGHAQSTVMGVFLLGPDDPEPGTTAVVQGSSDPTMSEGNTEDTPEATEDNDPLQVELDDNNLTIKSKKQRLAAVVVTIAELLSVPAEIRFESDEIVDTEIKDTPLEDVVGRLSPNLRLYVRADLTHSKRKPLRLALVPPVASVPDAANNQ